MARPRKYPEERTNTSIRLSDIQKKTIYDNFDTVQAFIEASYFKLESRVKKKKTNKRKR